MISFSFFIEDTQHHTAAAGECLRRHHDSSEPNIKAVRPANHFKESRFPDLKRHPVRVGGGANGSGKTTIFRLITGRDEPDDGNIAFSKKIKIGYFSQKVGDMKGRTVLQEVISGSDDVVALGQQMKELELIFIVHGVSGEVRLKSA